MLIYICGSLIGSKLGSRNTNPAERMCKKGFGFGTKNLPQYFMENDLLMVLIFL